MRKLLNRPALALAAALSLIFLIILIRTYCIVLDVSIPILVEENRHEMASFQSESDQSSDDKSQRHQLIMGPQLPNHIKYSTLNTNVTLG